MRAYVSVIALGVGALEFSLQAAGERDTLKRELQPVSLTASFISSVTTPSTIRPIVSPVEVGISERLQAVHSLSVNLSRAEITALYSFLQSPPTPDEKNIPGLHVLKNDILNALRDQTTPPAGLTDTMISIYHDAAQDSVTRDYAIQHLISWHEQGAKDSPNAQEKIRTVLHEAMRENSSIAGTALLGMHRLSAHDTTFDSAAISKTALHFVQAAQTPPATRITAIQVCAERDLKEALPAIEALAQTSGNLVLKTSALAALRRWQENPKLF